MAWKSTPRGKPEFPFKVVFRLFSATYEYTGQYTDREQTIYAVSAAQALHRLKVQQRGEHRKMLVLACFMIDK